MLAPEAIADCVGCKQLAPPAFYPRELIPAWWLAPWYILQDDYLQAYQNQIQSALESYLVPFPTPMQDSPEDVAINEPPHTPEDEEMDQFGMPGFGPTM